MNRKYHYQLFCVLLVFLCFACTPKPTLVYHHKDFSYQELDVITILPMIDARNVVVTNPEADEMDEDIESYRQMIAEGLNKKEYKTRVVDDPNTIGDILPAQIPFLDASQISEIGPKDARWILLPVAVSDRPPDVICYLFDKTRGKLMWEGSGHSGNLEWAFKGVLHRFPNRG